MLAPRLVRRAALQPGDDVIDSLVGIDNGLRPMISSFGRTFDVMPRYNEDDHAYEATLRTPQRMQPEDVRVEYDDGMLRVSGENRFNEGGYSAYSSFSYSSTFPAEAKHAEATVTGDGQGRLRVRVPK